MITDFTLRVILLVWLINEWDYENIDTEIEFLYALLKKEIYMKTSEEMSEVLEEDYTYTKILTLIKYIYGIVQALH